MGYRAYPDYRDSGVAWLGAIPKNWIALAIKRIGQFQGGAGFPDDEQGLKDEALPFYKVSDMNTPGNEVFMNTENNSISHDTAARLGAKVIPRDSVIFPKVGAVMLLNKRRITTKDCCIDNNVMCFTPLNGDSKWLYYWLTGLDLKPFSNPGAVPSINEGQLQEIHIPLPSPAEQKQIARFLDHKTAQIDALIAKKEALLQKLAEKRTALISQAVTQGLNPTVPMKDSGVAWLGKIPAHWTVKPVKFVGKIGNGSTPNRDKADYWTDGTYPWLNSSVVNQEVVTEAADYVTETALRECHLPIIKPPAVLVGITGQGKTRGMASTLAFEATINQHIAYVKPTTADMDINYLRRIFDRAYSFLRNESDGGGSTKGAITCEQIASLKLPFPPVLEQKQIAAFADFETRRMSEMAQKVQTAIERLKEYRSTLISAVVTGKIDVRKFQN